MNNSIPSKTERLCRPSRLRSLMLGQTKMAYVPDGAIQLGPRGFLPDTTDDVRLAHPEYLDSSGQ